MLAIFKIQIQSASNDGTEGNAKFPTYNSQTQEIKLMPIKFKCVSKVASAMITNGVAEGVATGRLTTEPYQTESGKNRNRTVFVIEKFNALDVQAQPSPLTAELEATKAELAALKSQLAASASKPPNKAKTTTKPKTKKVEVAAVSAPESTEVDDDYGIPF